MRWLELSLTVPPELVEPVAEAFHRFGRGPLALEEPGGFVEGEEPAPPGGPVTVRAYIPMDSRARWRRARVEVALRLLSLIQPLPPLRVREVQAGEWLQGGRASFQALRVGRRLVVCPPWQSYTPRPGEVVVLLEPGLAFGTGHHPTTRLCLQALEALLSPGYRVLDLGTGSGILSAAALRLGASWVLALDIDPQAVRSARHNLRLNGVRRARVAKGTLPHPLATPATFDLALANITARVVVEKAPYLASALRPGGWLVASGFLEGQEGEVLQALGASGLELRERRVEEGWACLLARR